MLHRRLTVAVAVASGVRVFADTGGRLRQVSLRGGAGLLTLQPDAGLGSLTLVRGVRRKRLAFDAPPGNGQCGWSHTADAEVGR